MRKLLYDYLRKKKPYQQCIKLGWIVLLTATLNGCKSPFSFEEDFYSPVAIPTVLTFEELRITLRMEDAKPLEKNGKIVIYQNYLLVNEPDKGVHIYNNTAPESPIQLGFLPIPGNTDITIRNDVLYANNYVDLVTFDIQDISNIVMTTRSENVFSPPYDANRFDVDPSVGIVIAYEYE